MTFKDIKEWSLIFLIFGIPLVFFAWDDISQFLGLTSKPTSSYQLIEGDNYYRDDDPVTERSYAEYGDYDCSDFSSWSEAQDFFESEGGPDEDYHNLDRDGDGIACEALQ